MVVSNTSQTRMLLEIPSGSNLSKISSVNGAVADIFDSSGNIAIRPCDLAERFNSSNIWFSMDLSGKNIMDAFREMGKLAHSGFSNFGILLSGIKDVCELERARFLAAEFGFSLGAKIPFGVIIEYPGMALSYEAISESGASFAVIDVDRVSKKTMCIDNAGNVISRPVSKIIKDSVGHFRDKRINVAVRGTMLEHSSVLDELVGRGVDYVLACPANMEKIRLKLLYSERKRELSLLKDAMKPHLKRVL